MKVKVVLINSDFYFFVKNSAFHSSRHFLQNQFERLINAIFIFLCNYFLLQITSTFLHWRRIGIIESLLLVNISPILFCLLSRLSHRHLFATNQYLKLLLRSTRPHRFLCTLFIHRWLTLPNWRAQGASDSN